MLMSATLQTKTCLRLGKLGVPSRDRKRVELTESEFESLCLRSRRGGSGRKTSTKLGRYIARQLLLILYGK